MATPWDAVYKELFGRFLRDLGVSVRTQVEVGRLPRALDAVVTADKPQRALLAQALPFDYFQLHNLLEFKSPNDPLTPDEYKRIIARAYLFLAEVGENDLGNVTVTIITATKPHRVLKGVPNLVRFTRESPGRYRSDEKLPLWVLVASELPVEERNYLLLLFTKGRKLKEVLWALMRKGRLELLRISYELHPREVSEVLAMSKAYPTLEENIQFIAQSLQRALEKTLENNPTFTSQVLSEMLTATVKISPQLAPQILSQVLSTSVKISPQLASQILSQVLSTSVKISPQLAPQILSQVLSTSVKISPQLAPQILSQVLSTSVKISPQLAPQILSQVLSTSVKISPQLAPQILSEMLRNIVAILGREKTEQMLRRVAEEKPKPKKPSRQRTDERHRR